MVSTRHVPQLTRVLARMSIALTRLVPKPPAAQQLTATLALSDLPLAAHVRHAASHATCLETRTPQPHPVRACVSSASKCTCATKQQERGMRHKTVRANSAASAAVSLLHGDKGRAPLQERP